VLGDQIGNGFGISDGKNDLMTTLEGFFRKRATESGRSTGNEQSLHWMKRLCGRASPCKLENGGAQVKL
jgi:hypothetical protein